MTATANTTMATARLISPHGRPAVTTFVEGVRRPRPVGLVRCWVNGNSYLGRDARSGIARVRGAEDGGADRAAPVSRPGPSGGVACPARATPVAHPRRART